MCKMHSFHGRKYQEEKSIFYSVTIKLSPLLFVTLTQHSKECWRKILDGWIDLCERKRVSQLQELLFVSLATFVSNFRGAAAQFTGIATFELWTDIGSCPLGYRRFSAVTARHGPEGDRREALQAGRPLLSRTLNSP